MTKLTSTSNAHHRVTTNQTRTKITENTKITEKLKIKIAANIKRLLTYPNDEKLYSSIKNDLKTLRTPKDGPLAADVALFHLDVGKALIGTLFVESLEHLKKAFQCDYGKILEIIPLLKHGGKISNNSSLSPTIFNFVDDLHTKLFNTLKELLSVDRENDTDEVFMRSIDIIVQLVGVMVKLASYYVTSFSENINQNMVLTYFQRFTRLGDHIIELRNEGESAGKVSNDDRAWHLFLKAYNILQTIKLLERFNAYEVKVKKEDLVILHPFEPLNEEKVLDDFLYSLVKFVLSEEEFIKDRITLVYLRLCDKVIYPGKENSTIAHYGSFGFARSLSKEKLEQIKGWFDKVDSDSVDAGLILGVILYNEGNHVEALKYLEMAYDKSKQALSLYNTFDVYSKEKYNNNLLSTVCILSIIYFTQGVSAKSIQYLKEYVGLATTILAPLNQYLLVRAYNSLGYISFFTDNTDDAIEYFKLAQTEIKLNKIDYEGNNRMLIILGESYLSKRDYSKARQYFNEAHKLIKRNLIKENELLFSYTLYALGMINFKEKNFSNAIPKLIEAQKYLGDADNIYILYSLAVAYFNLNQDDNALDCLKTVFNNEQFLTPKIRVLLQRLQAEICYFQKKLDEAIEWLIRSKDLLPVDDYNELNKNNFSIAKIWWEKGDCENALQYLSQINYTATNKELLSYADLLQQEIAVSPQAKSKLEVVEVDQDTYQQIEELMKTEPEIVSPIPSVPEKFVSMTKPQIYTPLVSATLSNKKRKKVQFNLRELDGKIKSNLNEISSTIDPLLNLMFKKKGLQKSEIPQEIKDLVEIAFIYNFNIANKLSRIIVPKYFFEDSKQATGVNKLPRLKVTSNSGGQGIKHYGSYAPNGDNHKLFAIKSLGKYTSKERIILKQLECTLSNTYVAIFKVTKSEKIVKKVNSRIKHSDLDDITKLIGKLEYDAIQSRTNSPGTRKRK